jgi:membrane protease YdiL (CAAX protease family)
MSAEAPPPRLPPILPQPEGEPGEAPTPQPKPPVWRVVAALVVLGFYVVLPGILGAGRQAGDAAILPATASGVLELTMFGAAFVLTVWLARLTAQELRLRWRGGWWVVPRAFGWSILLRLGVGFVLAAVLLAWHWIGKIPLDELAGFRPEVESVVDVSSLRNPLYMFLMLTLVSFVLAGLREELWRAGMLALLGRLFPRWFGGRWGPWLAILPVALLFGLGHTPQGWMGVLATTVVGIGLGAILVFHRSIWDAVLAHGFFNAATFAVLPWLSQKIPDLLRQ